MPRDFHMGWAALYEGAVDEAYLGLLIPRLLGEIVLDDGIRNVTIPSEPAVALRRQSVEQVAQEACSNRAAFHIVFIHADTGGRAQEANLEHRSTQYCNAMHTLCCWPPIRCITVSPRHETEAWMLTDPHAVTEALGYHGSPHVIGLPADAAQAERLVDPKAVLAAAVTAVRGRRRALGVHQIIPAIVQRQSFTCLRQSSSFTVFEAAIRVALADLGAI